MNWMEMDAYHSDFVEIARRVADEVQDEIDRESLLSLSRSIQCYPELMVVITPDYLARVLDEMRDAQGHSAGTAVHVEERHGFYPLAGKIARQPWVATLLDDSLARLRTACSKLRRVGEFKELVRKLQSSNPQDWMAGLLEVTAFGALERSGFEVRPYEPGQLDLLVETGMRPLHLDCQCITRTDVDKYCRPSENDFRRDHLDRVIDLLKLKLTDKTKQLRKVGKEPRGIIVGCSKFGPEPFSILAAVSESFCGEDPNFEFLSLVGITSGTAAHEIVWILNPAPEIPLHALDLDEIAKIHAVMRPVRRAGDWAYPTRAHKEALRRLSARGPTLFTTDS